MKKTTITLLALLGMSQAVAQESDYLPIVREGVKWVNEKVIVNHGDTTRYYYNYEFSGEDTWTNLAGDTNNACYYFLNDELNVGQDSLIAGMRGIQQVTCVRNNAYNNVLHENRVMFELPIYTDGGTRVLYNFSPYYNCILLYIASEYWWCSDHDTEPVLNEENFTEIESIEIDCMNCRRWSYVGEDGDTLCYIVEGIGFDSYDMGDLLTPFTRRPDPNADYQEWCGLSHVVKDGQIIYKGMRYRHGAFTGIDGVVAEQPQRPLDPQYYNLMGQPVGQDVPTTPGIYIHQGKKIVVR